MNQWNFVVAAYAIVLMSAALMVVSSWVAMRRAEAAADALRKR
jgi:hypothetical protein